MYVEYHMDICKMQWLLCNYKSNVLKQIDLSLRCKMYVAKLTQAIENGYR